MDEQAFIQICKKQIDAVKAGKLSIVEAARKISTTQRNNVGRFHPVFITVDHMVWDIADDHYVEAANQAYWQALEKILLDYEQGKWPPTAWTLCLNYTRLKNGKPVQGFSADITRRNGKTVLRAGDSALRSSLEKVIHQVSTTQTDEWFLRNVQMLLPATVSDLKLLDSLMSDGVTKQLYPTVSVL